MDRVGLYVITYSIYGGENRKLNRIEVQKVTWLIETYRYQVNRPYGVGITTPIIPPTIERTSCIRQDMQIRYSDPLHTASLVFACLDEC